MNNYATSTVGPWDVIAYDSSGYDNNMTLHPSFRTGDEPRSPRSSVDYGRAQTSVKVKRSSSSSQASSPRSPRQSLDWARSPRQSLDLSEAELEALERLRG